MTFIFARLLILCVCFAWGSDPMPGEKTAACPSFNDVPIAYLHPGYPENNFFYGGRWFHGEAHDVPALSCTGTYWDGPDGYRSSAPPGHYYPVHSLLVNPGCSFYFFHDYNYWGTYTEFYGGSNGLLLSNVHLDSNTHSYLVTCQQRFPTCTPSDGWKTITSLDNSQSNFPTPFTFQQTIGTTWSHSASDSMSVSARVEGEISTSFFGFFETKLGFSVETGYNWGSVSSKEKSESHTYTVGPINVPAGERVLLEGAVGTCGANTVNTQMYRVISSKTGEILSIVN